MRFRLGRKATPAVDEPVEEQLDAQATPVASAGQVVSAGLATKAIHLVLVMCLVAGPVGLAVGWMAFTRRAPAAVSAAPASQVSPDADVAGLFAAEVVTTWLTASRSDSEKVAAVLPGLQVGTLPDAPFKVRDVVVGPVTSAGAGVFSVTVGVTVTDVTKTSVRRHYQMAVRVDDQGVAVLGLPAFVALPGVVPAGPLTYETRLDARGDAATAAGQFLTALLSGQGEVSRYVSPGVQIVPIRPAPFGQVRIDEVLASGAVPAVVTDGARLQVQVSVTGVVNARQQIRSSYWLTLTARGGRWEIASIDPQPAAATPTDSRRSPTPGSTTR